MSDDTLRRGEPEDRSNFQRARDNFEEGKGDVRSVERMDVCPTCEAPMLITKSYRAPDAYHMTGECSAHEDHNVERYGYYVTDTESSP